VVREAKPAALHRKSFAAARRQALARLRKGGLTLGGLVPTHERRFMIERHVGRYPYPRSTIWTLGDRTTSGEI
jgi:hypothetical protein